MQYNNPQCMKCLVPFTKQFSIKNGLVLVYKNHHRNILWEREKSLLPDTQIFLEWENEMNLLKKRLRFGERVQFPPKPRLVLSSSSETTIFACPGLECRGFVSGLQCGVCRKPVCSRCREFIEIVKDDEPKKGTSSHSKHKCDQETVESIKAIQTDSKQCPRCKVSIFRIEGCDHMFCTHCRTHFQYSDGKILQKSSNHHYERTPVFSKNITSYFTSTSKSASTTECNQDPLVDSIPSSVVDFVQLQNSNLYRALWSETSAARFLLRKRFSGVTIEVAHQESLLAIRLLFLRNLITEEQAKSRVLLEDEKQEKIWRQRSLLEMYLNTVNDLQRYVYVDRSLTSINEACHIYENLIETCMDASGQTQKELGGECLKFSCDFESSVPHVTL